MHHELQPIEPPPPRWSWRFNHVLLTVIISAWVLAIAGSVVETALGLASY